MSEPTTRYGRRKARAAKFGARYVKWKNKQTKCGKVGGKTVVVGKHPVVPLGPKQSLLTKHPGRTVATLPGGFPNFPHPLVTGAAADAPNPYVKILHPFYLAFRASGQHQYQPFVHYHVRRRKMLPTHVKPYRRTARDRKITGANWMYFRTGYFPDWDILSRHPNQTDEANGLPPGSTAWPVPLGY